MEWNFVNISIKSYSSKLLHKVQQPFQAIKIINKTNTLLI